MSINGSFVELNDLARQKIGHDLIPKRLEPDTEGVRALFSRAGMRFFGEGTGTFRGYWLVEYSSGWRLLARSPLESWLIDRYDHRRAKIMTQVNHRLKVEPRFSVIDEIVPSGSFEASWYARSRIEDACGVNNRYFRRLALPDDEPKRSMVVERARGYALRWLERCAPDWKDPFAYW